MCGEKSIVAPSSGPCTGSPPRMRGKELPRSLPGKAGGITPAYAGKSKTDCLALCLCQGSPPRMRGKASTHSTIASCTGITPAYAGKSRVGAPSGNIHKGSPPRMRGKGNLSLSVLHISGITPAYAGKSGPCPDRGPPAGDHPRVCGEKGADVDRRGLRMGSPPRMRGKD